MGFLKLLIAVILLPFAFGLVKSFWTTVISIFPLTNFEIWFLPGFVIFFVIFLIKSVPGKIYVFGHELTHAFLAILFRGKVEKFKVSSKGGSVVTTKSNFLVSLSPYFFPIYTFFVIFIFYVLSLVFSITKYIEWLFFLVGFSYSFHIFLTIESLLFGQQDVKKTGKFFSYTVIVIFNIVVATVILKFVSPEKIALSKYFSKSYTVALEICIIVWRHLTELYSLV